MNSQPAAQHVLRTDEPTSLSDDVAAQSDVYQCLVGRLPSIGDYRLISLRERDVESIRIWRNAQMTVLRQTSTISKAEQLRYFDRVVRPTFRTHQPTQILLSILFENSCVGYTGLTNIDWNAGRAEISFLLAPSRVENPVLYDRDFQACLLLLSHTAFELLGFHRLYAETYDVRPRHIETLERHGFQLEGRMRDHVRIDGAAVDALIHGLLENEWRTAKTSTAGIADESSDCS